MSNARQPRAATTAQRVALAQLIEKKVNRLDIRALVKLAADLHISIPTKLRAMPAVREGIEMRQHSADALDFVGDGIGPVVSATEGGLLLDAITTEDATADWADTELLGAGDLAERLNVSRGTLDNWRKANKIIGFRKGLRNFVYPTRQFERLKPIDGLDRIVTFFPTAEDAWEWLVIPNHSIGDKAPIDRLRAGEVEYVVRAAEGALDYA